ncbi:MAG TPA: 4a-hydroxytetrahydrobiopterin dehydratase [Longimicrobiales bacterium]|nr:4a-hydroxytetrahydrobiopterin dehydratase [Longimicrobiales bacterium]
MNDDQLQDELRSLPAWEVCAVEGIGRLRRVFRFNNFVDALEFTNRVGALAEEHNHHPQITTEWGRTTVEWWTHTEGGVGPKDLLLARKTDQL